MSLIKKNINELTQYTKNIFYKKVNQSLVLLYHRINKLDTSHFSLTVTPKRFEEQIKYLNDRFNIISLSKLISQLKNSEVKNNSIVITIDDGYNDNLYYAKPILEKYNVPATVFVTAGMLGREFWWDELERIIQINHSDIYKKLELNIKGKEFSWIIKNSLETKRVYKELHNLLKYTTEEERSQKFKEIWRWTSTSRTERVLYKALTADEVKKLASGGLIEIGAHTLTHPCLSCEPLEVQKYQIEKSKGVLEKILGYEVKIFSYPFGTSLDINREIIELTKKAGYESAIAFEQGLVHNNSDPYRIPRYSIQNWDLNELQDKIDEYLLVEDIFDLIRQKFKKNFVDRKAEKYFKEKIIPNLKKYPLSHNKFEDLKNILQLNGRLRKGGPDNVVYNLHKKYKDLGYNSKILVENSIIADDDIIFLLKDNSNIQKRLYTLKKKQGLRDFSNLSSFKIKNLELFKQADVIHLHNIRYYFFNLFALPEISSLKPVVWTLHDMQSFTANCEHSFDCNQWQKSCVECPNLLVSRKVKRNSSSLVWNFKKYIYENSKLTIVCPSKWLKNKVEKSMLKKFDIVLIYNSVDNQIFCKTDKIKARDILNLPKKKKILTFCAKGGINNTFKGGQILSEIQSYFKNNTDVVFLILGGSNYQYNRNLIEVGFIHSEELLSLYYSASDLLIYPSIADVCPLVILESMACGTPVVTFNTGGIPELVKHQETGYIAKYKDIEDFINGINYFLKDELKLEDASIKSIERVRKNFTLDRMVKQYLNLYNELGIK